MKKSYFFILLTFPCLFLNAQPESFKKKSLEIKKDPYILQSFWQTHFLNKLKKKEEKSSLQTAETLAWGLFSYGGWGDDGQIFILKNNSSLSFYTADSGVVFLKENKDLAKFLTQTIIPNSDLKQWQDWQEKISKLTKNLVDLETKAFDGIEYQYIFARKKRDQDPIIKRIYMNNPQISNSKEHNDLLKLFHSMRQKYAKKEETKTRQ